MHWDFALILIFLAAVVPWLGRRRVQRLMQEPQTSKADRLALYASTIAFQWIAVAVILWRVAAHGISLAQLGVAISNGDLVLIVAIILAGLILANQLVSLRQLTKNPDELHGIVSQLALKIFPQDAVERLAFFAVVVTVAFCEELIYRGFVQHVLRNWLGGLTVAGILGSAAMFGLAHVYQGRRGLIAAFVVGLLFSVARAWTGSLAPSIVAHFVADFSAGLLSPSRVRAALERVHEHEGADTSPGPGES